MVQATSSEDVTDRFPHPGRLFCGRWSCRSSVLLSNHERSSRRRSDQYGTRANRAPIFAPTSAQDGNDRHSELR